MALAACVARVNAAAAQTLHSRTTRAAQQQAAAVRSSSKQQQQAAASKQQHMRTWIGFMPENGCLPNASSYMQPPSQTTGAVSGGRAYINMPSDHTSALQS